MSLPDISRGLFFVGNIGIEVYPILQTVPVSGIQSLLFPPVRAVASVSLQGARGPGVGQDRPAYRTTVKSYTCS